MGVFIYFIGMSIALVVGLLICLAMYAWENNPKRRRKRINNMLIAMAPDLVDPVRVMPSYVECQQCGHLLVPAHAKAIETFDRDTTLLRNGRPFGTPEETQTGSLWYCPEHKPPFDIVIYDWTHPIAYREGRRRRNVHYFKRLPKVAPPPTREELYQRDGKWLTWDELEQVAIDAEE